MNPLNPGLAVSRPKTTHIKTVTKAKYLLNRNKARNNPLDSIDPAYQWTGAVRIAARNTAPKTLEKFQVDSTAQSREAEENIGPYILLTGVGMLLITIFGSAPL